MGELLRERTEAWPGGWFADGDELRARRPGLRRFRVHPDLGVEELAEHVGYGPSAGALSVDWLALPVEEQRLRLRDVRRGLLARAAADDDARVLVEAREDVPLVAALRALPERFAEPEAGRFEGRLDDDAVDLLAACEPPARIRVQRAGRLWLEADEDWHPEHVAVWIQPSDAPELQTAVTDAWWAPAQERRAAATSPGLPEPAPRDGGRASRATRAHVHHLLTRFFDRYTGALIAGAVGWLLGDAWTSALVAFVVGLAVLLTISEAVRGWYERS